MSGGHVHELRRHQAMLGDVPRTNAFRQAIHAVVRPGMTVCDLGSGTGVLAFFACQAGAERVYAVESTEYVTLAAGLARDNGYDDRITFLRGDAREVELPEQVDVVVSEWLGSFAVNDGMLDVAARMPTLLKPGGVVIPCTTEVWVAPVAAGRSDQLQFWTERRYDLDFSRALDWARNTPHHVQLFHEELCAPPVLAASIDGYTVDPASFTASATVRIAAPTVVEGLAGWFVSTLAPGTRLTNRPGSRNHWGQLMFPIDPVGTAPGDELRFEVRFDGTDQHFEWSATLIRDHAVVHLSDHNTRCSQTLRDGAAR